nr:hypothetical protein [Planctomycetota bacterium]
VFATPATETGSDLVEIRTVVVESGELADCQLVAVHDIVTTVPGMIAAASNLLPVQGYATTEGADLVVTCGAIHGLRVGDRLRIWSGSAAERGTPAATATVSVVARASAIVVIDGAPQELRGRPVSRTER